MKISFFSIFCIICVLTTLAIAQEVDVEIDIEKVVEQEETNKYISSNDNANVNANANANANVKNSNDDVDVSKVLNIAVVGGGIGGSSVAHFTSKLFQTNPELFQSKYANISITVFEASPRLCGRVMSKVINGSTIELGASIYHISNELVYNLTTELGLKRIKGFDDGFGVWNGTAFTFETSQLKHPWINFFHTLGKVLWRYGTAPLQSSYVSKTFLHGFRKLYKNVFESVEDLLRIAGIDNLARTSMNEWVRDNKFSSVFAREIIEGAARVNYGQNLEMSALGAWVSMVGSEDDVYSIADGNEQICYKITGVDRAQVLKGSSPTHQVTNGNIHTFLNAPVSQISKRGTKYSVEYRHNNHLSASDFDVVVIATPLEATNITLENIDITESTKPTRAYHNIYVTIVHGEVNPKYFGKSTISEVPPNILTLEPDSREFTPLLHKISASTTERVPFTSFSLLQKKEVISSSGPERYKGIYKFFSPKPLSNSTLAKVFTSTESVFQQTFPAYPVLVPFSKGSKYPTLRIEKNLYYLNAIESAASAMEMEALAALSISKMIGGAKP